MKRNPVMKLAAFAAAASIIFSLSAKTPVRKNPQKAAKPRTEAQAPKTMTQDNTKPLSDKDAVVDIKTSLGDIKVLLYGDTPRHRDNFLKLAREGYYDGVLFHRVIKDFMVQTGDPESKNATPDQQLGSGDPSYTLEAEILYPKHYHKYGALAAARTADQVNPERRSSGSQFYIVTGQKFTPSMMEQVKERALQGKLQGYFSELCRKNSQQIDSLRRAGDSVALEALRQKLIAETEANVKPDSIPESIMADYTTVGGTPHLDGQYTVFGEVISGMDVVEKIQNAETGAADRPKEDIRIISMKVE